MTAPVQPPPWRNKPLIGAILLLVCGVLLAGGLLGGDYFLTLSVSKSTARQVATAVEQARAIAAAKAKAAEDAAAAKAKAAEIKSALLECTALQGLAAIKGSHVASATYGYHLQTGIADVYAKSGCPALLRQYGPKP